MILRRLRESGAETPKVVCVIGDGYGFFSSLVHQAIPGVKVVTVNLGRTLLFDAYFCSLATKAPLGLIARKEDREPILAQSAISFLEAENYAWLAGMPIDLFLNVASMQEMNNDVLKNYFGYMRASSATPRYLYCCNRVDKTLPDGERLVFEEYPWSAGDRKLLDELCPWYEGFPDWKPPFWRPFDGPVQHRLAELADR